MPDHDHLWGLGRLLEQGDVQADGRIGAQCDTRARIGLEPALFYAEHVVAGRQASDPVVPRAVGDGDLFALKRFGCRRDSGRFDRGVGAGDDHRTDQDAGALLCARDRRWKYRDAEGGRHEQVIGSPTTLPRRSDLIVSK